MTDKIKCPCCSEVLLVSLDNGEIELSSSGDNDHSDIELSEILSKNNIEFG